ncbi:hypothetical protein OXIME_000710 [Oxyplasma meridianum]|uniref:DUF1102 domain-containing protein n=1 Tax=Oxyplasma meridianum TaxID=3073602 RepID=A0AAX4NGA8_9ARCH
MKRSMLSILVIFIALMVPAVATASVVISDPISVVVSDTGSNHIFIAKGPGYGIANGLGYIKLIGNNANSSNVSVDLYSVPGNGYLELVNVLEINNTLKSGEFANVTLSTSSMPSGVFLYYNNTSQSKVVGGTITGVNVSATDNTATFQVNSGSSPVYLSFLVMGGSAGTGSITFSYSIN